MLARLRASLLKEPAIDPSIHDIWGVMSAALPVLADLSFAATGDHGVVLDSSAWADLEFCEGASLHYSPESIQQPSLVRS